MTQLVNGQLLTILILNKIYKYNGQRAIEPRNFLVGGGRARVAGVNSDERQLLFLRKVNK